MSVENPFENLNQEEDPSVREAREKALSKLPPELADRAEALKKMAADRAEKDKEKLEERNREWKRKYGVK